MTEEKNQENAFTITYAHLKKNNKIKKFTFHSGANYAHKLIWIQHLQALANGNYNQFLRTKLRTIVPQIGQDGEQ